MNNDMRDKIITWLGTQGYPLEMTVASALREVGFDVSQGEYYDDPETKTQREIDVIARKGDDYGLLEISIVVECKKSTEKPWVLFTSDKHASGKNIFFSYAIMSELAREKLSKLVIDRLAWDMQWLKKNERTAYGMAVAFASGEDPAYKAVLGALKASISQNRIQSNSGYVRSLRFIFPVVVLDGKLFEAYIDTGGNIVVQEVEEGIVTYYRDIAGVPASSVRVVTADRLSSFCQDAMATTNQIKELLKTDIEKMWQELKDMKAGKRRIFFEKES